MKVFMLGWEFPPYISGGLGTACYGITRGLDEIGVRVSFVLPNAVPVEASSHVALRSPSTLGLEVRQAQTQEEPIPQAARHVRLHRIAAMLSPYAHPGEIDDRVLQEYLEQTEALLHSPTAGAEAPTDADNPEEPTRILPRGTFTGGPGHYAGDLMGQVHRYARLAVELARTEEFDVVHAHDWMTFPAGIAVAAATGKPLVIQIHSTEFDRSGEHVWQQVYDIERAGMHAARKVVCVSHLTSDLVVRRYGVAPDKVEVVYNAVDLPEDTQWKLSPIRSDEKIVLFLGRVTMQKGPEYFLQAARKVVDRFPKVRFVVAGTGDMVRRCIDLVAELRLGSYVTFTGFLRGDDVKRIFRMADLYVMPSVSEPFGIAPLEAISHNVPVIISKQSGVSEVITHALKVDFWDVEEMANKMLAVLRHPPLQRVLKHHGQFELHKLSWSDTARKLERIYQSVV